MIRRRNLLALGGGVLLLAACDSGPDFGPPATLTKSALETTATVGTTFPTVRITVKDGDGKSVKGGTVTWSADAGGTASPSRSETDDDGRASTSWTLGTLAGTQTLRATIGDLEATFQVNAVAADLALLEIDDGGRVLHAIGDTLHVIVVAEDTYGNEVGDPGIAWSTLDPAATVAAGIVTAAANGTARIVASAGSLADTVTVEVDQVVAGIGVRPARPRVLALQPSPETLQLTAVAVDSNGVAVQDTAVTPAWSSSNSAVAAVDAAGLLEAVSVGDAVLTATAGEFQVQASFRVKTGPRPTISSIAPDPVSPGDIVTITGTDFSATPSLNTVTIGGTAAEVMTASPTELTAAVSPDALPCAPTADVEVVVVVDELETSADHPAAGATQHALAVGESVTLTGAGVGCNELSQPGSYVISVFNATNSAGATSGYRLRGTLAGAVVAEPGMDVAAAMDALPRRRTTIQPRAARIEPRPEELAHARMLEMNYQVLERLGRPAPAPALRTAAVPTVGDIMALRIPDVDASNACTTFKAVSARVVFVGDYGVVLEDTLAPLAGDIDNHWQTVGQEYDDGMHQLLLDHFGDPLVLDAELDANQRLLMLFSKQVNDFEAGIAGFVFSGDFFPRSQCASSDLAEIFYGTVPTQMTDTQNEYAIATVKGWLRVMRSTVIHEVKHILSFANRIDQAPTGQNPSYEERWLEEATARLAEEFYGRAKYGYTQGGNTQYEASIYCEVRPSASRWPECGEGSPYIMAKHFFALHDYYSNVERLTPLGSANSDDFTFYGSGWLFVRWALDQTAGNESDLVRSLVTEPTLAGVANIAARTGRSFPEMLADFSLGLAVDDREGFTPARPALSFPGWDSRDIFLDLYNDFHDQLSYLREFPLAVRPISFGNFDVSVSQVRGGSASLLELGGTLSGSQLLELLSGSGGTAPPSLGLALVRVQ